MTNLSLEAQKKGRKWDQAYVRYFEKNIEPKLEYFCVWSIHGKCPYDEVRQKKDIRFSLEVWVPADRIKLHHNLNIQEKRILESKQWVNDIIIDSAMNLLSYQFPDLQGFQSCQLAHQPDFDRHKKLFIQIINRSPIDGGSHWLTVSNINCMENTIKIYDSAYCDLPHEEELTVASLVAVTSDRLQVIFPNVALQTNGYDCGLYAVANATALAYGRDPTTHVYIPRMMRSHLYKCFENKHIEPFPMANTKAKQKKQKKVFDVPLYCVCNMPDTRTKCKSNDN